MDPEIRAFLDDGGYATLDDWMADSDYTKDSDGNWHYDDPVVGDHIVIPEGCIEGAMESSGWFEQRKL